MKKIKEAMVAILWATRYSLAFCLRNNKQVTIIRLILEIFTTLLLYFSIQITGDVVNVVQSQIGKFNNSDNQFLNFIQSGIVVQLLYFILILIIGVVINEASRYFRKIWFQSLHF